MTSYDKVIKLACKPKAAPPKAKVCLIWFHVQRMLLMTSEQYLDPIIAATWSEDGAVHDVCKALGPRFREPNAIVRSAYGNFGLSHGMGYRLYSRHQLCCTQ